MKKSQFIKEVLSDTSNTVFVNEEQVENTIELFEKLGMFYCPVKDYGDFQLRTPKDWEEE